MKYYQDVVGFAVARELVLNPDLDKFLANWYLSHYNTINASADGNSLAFKVLHSSLEAPFKTNAGLKILEVGANKGEHLNFVASDFNEYVMSDIRNVSISIDQNTSRVTFRQASVESLPFDDNSFDRAISTCLFHHIDDPFGGFLELRRVTKRLGKISILIPNDPGLTYRFLRNITSMRRAKRHGLQNELRLVYSLEHKNHFLSLQNQLKYAFRHDNIFERPFPLPWNLFNLNAFTVFQIQKLTN